MRKTNFQQQMHISQLHRKFAKKSCTLPINSATTFAKKPSRYLSGPVLELFKTQLILSQRPKMAIFGIWQTRPFICQCIKKSARLTFLQQLQFALPSVRTFKDGFQIYHVKVVRMTVYFKF